MITSKTKIASTLALAAVLAASSATLAGCNSSPNVVASAPTSTAQADNVNSPDTLEDDAIAARTRSVEVTEGEVERFISQYRTYIGATNDADFATLLDQAGATPEDIRKTAIEQLLKNKLAAAKAAEAGIEVTDDELSEYISSVKDGLGYSENSQGWSDALDVSGYDEDAYQEDVRTKLLIEKLIGQENGSMEASESQMLAYANDNPTDYVGANLIIIEFKTSQRSSALEFCKSVEGANISEFRELAAEEVGSGRAQQVVDWGWTAINVPSSVVLQATAELQPGQCVTVQDDDGLYKVLYVSEIFVLQPSGRVDYANMPDDLKSKLKSDASAANRANIVSHYLDGLYSEDEVSIADIPANASYNVDMTLSSYGADDGTLSDEEMAANAANQIAQMEQSNVSSQE